MHYSLMATWKGAETPGHSRDDAKLRCLKGTVDTPAVGRLPGGHIGLAGRTGRHLFSVGNSRRACGRLCSPRALPFLKLALRVEAADQPETIPDCQDDGGEDQKFGERG